MNRKGPEVEQSRSQSPTSRTGTVGRRGFGAENGMVWYLVAFQWVPILAPTYSLRLRFENLLRGAQYNILSTYNTHEYNINEVWRGENGLQTPFAWPW